MRDLILMLNGAMIGVALSQLYFTFKVSRISRRLDNVPASQSKVDQLNLLSEVLG